MASLIPCNIGLHLGYLTIKITVRVIFFGLSLIGFGPGVDIWVGSYNYEVTEWLRSISSIPGVQCTVISVKSTVCSLYSLYSAQWNKVWSVQCVVCSAQQCSVQCALWIVQFVVWSLHCRVCSVDQCQMCSVQFAVKGVQCVVCSLQCIMFIVYCQVCR